MTVAARAGSSPRSVVPSPVRRFVPVGPVRRGGDGDRPSSTSVPISRVRATPPRRSPASSLPALCWSRRRSRRRRGGRGPLHRPARGGRHRLAAFRMEQSRRRLRVHGGARAVRGLAAAACPAALRGPDERPLGRPAVALLIVAYATSLGMLGLAAAAVFDPLAQGCLDCPANHLLITSDADSWHELGQLGLLLSAIWTAAFAVLACGRLARFSRRAGALPRPCSCLPPPRWRSSGGRRARPRARLPVQRSHGPRAVGGRDGRARARGRRGRLGAREGAPRAPRWLGSWSTSAPHRRRAVSRASLRTLSATPR